MSNNLQDGRQEQGHRLAFELLHRSEIEVAERTEPLDSSLLCGSRAVELLRAISEEEEGMPIVAAALTEAMCREPLKPDRETRFTLPRLVRACEAAPEIEVAQSMVHRAWTRLADVPSNLRRTVLAELLKEVLGEVSRICGLAGLSIVQAKAWGGEGIAPEKIEELGDA